MCRDLCILLGRDSRDVIFFLRGGGALQKTDLSNNGHTSMASKELLC